jgi:hypothetical protein
MNCIVERRRRHRHLAAQLEDMPQVEAVDVLLPSESPSGFLETEVLVNTTPYRAVDTDVLATISAAELTIATITKANNSKFRHVCIR